MIIFDENVVKKVETFFFSLYILCLFCFVFSLQAEQVSLCGFINMFIVIVLALLWALLPTETAIFAHWFQNRILSVSANL